MSSVCNVAQVSITTKSASDDIATCYTYDHNGRITCSKASHITKGVVSLSMFFNDTILNVFVVVAYLFHGNVI